MSRSRRGAVPRASHRSAVSVLARAMVVPLALVLLAGCSSSNPSPTVSAAAPSSAPTSGSASLTPSAVATPAQSSVPATPVASGPTAGNASPTAPTATSPADLRLILPSSIGGHSLTKTQLSGTDILKQPGGVSSELSDTLSHFGKTPADLTVAFATDPTLKVDLSITALRVAGVSGADFLAAYAPELKKAFPEATIAQQTVAGKVVDAVTTAPNLPPSFLIVYDDVVFLVSGTDPTLAVAAVAGLP